MLLHNNVPNLCGIYIIRCLVTDKVYIGSAVKIRKRLNVHLHHLRKDKHHSPHLQRAWNKYGEKAFTFRVLDECSVDEKIELEQQYIDLYKSADRDFGYNINPKAEGQTGRKWTKEQRTKTILTKTGVKQSEESKQAKRDTWARNHNEWQQAIIDKRGLEYDIISPTGERLQGKGITRLAKQLGLHHSDLSRLIHGKAISLKGWKRTDYQEPPPYILLDPKGKETKIPQKEWAQFCRENNLNSDQLAKVRKGKLLQHRGWSNLNNAYLYVFLIGPQGQRERICRAAPLIVAKSLNLPVSSIFNLLLGKILSVKGWTLEENSHRYHNLYRFYTSHGELLSINRGDLQDWVTKNHLDYYPILNLATGRRLEYKGYKRYYPCIEAFNIVSNGSMIQETI